MKIFMDGENFRHSAAHVLKAARVINSSRELSNFPIRAMLAESLAENDLKIAYYTSKIKLPQGFVASDTILQRASEINEYNRKWIAGIVKQDIAHVKAGFLKVKSADPCRACGASVEVLQEKGVDVRLAVDLVTEFVGHQGQKIGIFSSDTDLIPAIDRVREQGHHLTYICFSDSINRAISAASDETVTIPKAKTVNFYVEHQ